MDAVQVMEVIGSAIENIGIVAVLIYAWQRAETRADRLQDHITDDWKAQNAREKPES